MINAPGNLQDLLYLCQQISGKSLGHLAKELQIPIPPNLLHAKGWMGQLIEVALGATAGTQAIPDFPQLGVELKTIPVNTKHAPLESTYVCTVNMTETPLPWRESWAYRKLKRVLWVPVLASSGLAISNRVVLSPILWEMDLATEEVLRVDWEELMEMIQTGHAKNISAKYGSFLHIRPKAASSKILTEYTDSDGNRTKMVPKGFYLRTSFTKALLQQHSPSFS